MKKILVIEDDLSIRETLKELLESENYNCVLAADGEKGLNMLAAENIDLVLLDLSMPVMDGQTFLQKVDEVFAKKKAIPVVIMTAAGPGEIPKNYDKNLIMRKPLDIDEIIEKIASLI